MEAPPFAGRPANPFPYENAGRHLKFGLNLFAGFLLPAFTIAFELITRMCAEVLFDPLPSLAHLAAVTAVPLINLKLLLMVKREQPVTRGWLFAGAAAAAVGLSYALLFLPVYPFAVIGIIYFGLGLLPFAPLSAGLTALFVTVGAARNAQRPYLRLMICGLLAGFVLVLALDAPTAITRAAVRGSVDADPAVRARSVNLMRNFGNRDLLLRLCYDSSGHTGGLLGLLVEGALSLQLDDFDRRRLTVSPGAARELYYRINGVPYNTVAPPFRGRGWRFADDFAWDADQGGTVIGGRVNGLSLHSSRIDGSMDADDAVAYVEWTTEFTNTSAMQREARMTLVLPPGGAVSRATLWVNGEEREAAFATRAAARAAYQAVVMRQRDPLLVTTNGADQVFVQMFPVPPGGTAKFRIGITAPLTLTNDGRATLALPAIVDRNFSIDAALRHAVWIEGEGSEANADSGFSMIAGENGVVRRRGNFTDQELAVRRPRISIARNPKAEEIASGTVMQTIRLEAREPARTFYVVLDGSLQA
ncbi:MAG TPA: VIT domain-containing protein, partial [Steroidobacteraceae bacterium]|nr:VIT domain-containing protein [Steroidobacteraceae bacterium]